MKNATKQFATVSMGYISAQGPVIGRSPCGETATVAISDTKSFTGKLISNIA